MTYLPAAQNMISVLNSRAASTLAAADVCVKEKRESSTRLLPLRYHSPVTTPGARTCDVLSLVRAGRDSELV